MTFNGNMEMAGQVLHVYASGDGALHFNWADPKGVSTSRRVKRWHCLRFLRTKEGKRLMDKGYKLFNINTQWQLVSTVVRKNKNTLCVDGETYTYTHTPLSPRNGHEVWDCDFTVYAKYPAYARRISGDKYEVKNWSIRAVIRFFLNHESELKRADSEGVVHYPG